MKRGQVEELKKSSGLRLKRQGRSIRIILICSICCWKAPQENEKKKKKSWFSTFKEVGYDHEKDWTNPDLR